jgi:dephospho-CoA kinase
MSESESVAPRPAPIVVLTGGIASGKSAVCDRLAELGVSVVDADVAAREVVVPGEPALAEIVALFGTEILHADGTLDRRRLREHVFADAAARRRLEGIVHPRVRERLRARLTRAPGSYAIAAIPLFAESSADYAWVDRVVVVDVPEALQVARLTARDGVNEELARAMVRAQASRAQRLARADEVILNSGSRTDLARMVDALHLRLQQWARSRA